MNASEPHDEWCMCDACMDPKFGRDHGEHGYDCDCDECELERAFDECGRLPPELGGGCSKAGSEDCDFDCPFRNAVLNDEEEEDE